MVILLASAIHNVLRGNPVLSNAFVHVIHLSLCWNFRDSVLPAGPSPNQWRWFAAWIIIRCHIKSSHHSQSLLPKLGCALQKFGIGVVKLSMHQAISQSIPCHLCIPWTKRPISHHCMQHLITSPESDFCNSRSPHALPSSVHPTQAGWPDKIRCYQALSLNSQYYWWWCWVDDEDWIESKTRVSIKTTSDAPITPKSLWNCSRREIAGDYVEK